MRYLKDVRIHIPVVTAYRAIVRGLEMTRSEAKVQQDAQLEASYGGGRLWRNNSGAYLDRRGVQVRYGLGNVSKKVNKRVKSSDLIGITPVRIVPAMVGKVVGVFTAVECKKQGWKFNPKNDDEVAQEHFHDIVRGLGGLAKFEAGE